MLFSAPAVAAALVRVAIDKLELAGFATGVAVSAVAVCSALALVVAAISFRREFH